MVYSSSVVVAALWLRDKKEQSVVQNSNLEHCKRPHRENQVVCCRNTTDLLMAEKIAEHHIAFVVAQLHHEVESKCKRSV